MFKLLKCKLLILFIVFGLKVNSQNSMLYIEEDYFFKAGVDLFEKQKYALAQDYFSQVINYYGTEHTDVKADAEYYSALCAIELFNDDASYRITKFIADYPESPRTRMAYFEMGKHVYRQEDYVIAIDYFNRVWKQHLNKNDLNEYYFKLGYSYFKLNENNKASKAFYELLNKNSKYSGPALYYYSHLAYIDGNYETALNGFNKLKDDPTFAPVAPYYIVQIYYLQGKSDKVLELGPELLSITKSKREAEISRLVGEALYAQENYTEALPYLIKYKEKADLYTREDIYQLGFAYYMNGKYNEAVEALSNVTNVEDELSQNAFFNMAHCYINLDEKDPARLAFNEASKTDFNEKIKEQSMLHYAKLSYELSYSPFNETINAFYNYLTSYPNSEFRDEAYAYLAKVYLTSKNYKEALASLDKIEIKSPEMMEAYQRVTFYRGLELFNNLQFEAALAAFELSLNSRSFDNKVKALTYYWQAEAFYRLQEYEKSADAYNKFLLTPGAYLLSEFNTSYYNLGYCKFKLKSYDESIIWFRKFIEQSNKVNKVKLSDAYIRSADCYFVTKKYSIAIEFYNEAIKLDTFDVDYAMFQKGYSYGLIKSYSKKNEALSDLLDISPFSVYAADALFERGRSYVAIDSIHKAISDFNELLTDYPNSSYVPKALLQLGLLNYTISKNDIAVESFKKVVENYYGSDEANDALIAMKNVYVDLNMVDDYFNYVQEVMGDGSINISEKDSLTYIAAERIYMDMQWQKAEDMFTSYIDNNQSNRFLVNAYYYRGDCYMRLEMADSALSDFMFVVEQPKNLFTEPSLVNAAQLQLKHKNHKLAAELFTKLENQAEIKSNLIIARKGQMQAHFMDSNYNQAIEAAKKVLITEKVAEEEIREARLIMAKSYQATNMNNLSITQYRILAQDVKNIEGAQSKYMVAKLLINDNNIDDAENIVLEFIGMGTPHQFWLAKSFLLLSEIYLLKGDSFQAKANLLSLMDNYTNTDDGILKEAEQKYDAIVTEENLQFKNNELEVPDTLKY